MKKSIRNVLIGMTIAIAFISFIYYKALPIQIEVETVEKRDLYKYVEEKGRVASKNESVITAKVSSQVVEVFVHNGSWVDSGDLLFKLDSEMLENQIEVLKAQMLAIDEEKSINASQIKHQINAQRISSSQLKTQKDYYYEILNQMKALYEKGSLSENELKAHQNSYDMADSAYMQNQAVLESLASQYNSLINSNGSIKSIQAQIDVLEAQMRDTNVYALTSGILTNFNIKIGAFVSPQIPVATIVDPNHYQIETYVLTNDVANLKMGDDVVLILKRNGIDHEYKGKISTISSSAEEKISSLGLSEQRIAVNIESDEIVKDVKAGYEVKVKFITEYELKALVIPKTTIFKIADDSYVYVVRDGRITAVPIKTAVENDSEIAVVSGLNEGELIVKNYKLEGLEDGKKVKIR